MNQVDPSSISIDACTICQLRCADCKVQQTLNDGGYSVGKGYLTFENFKRILDTSEGLKEIHFVNIGELFLNPDLEQIFRLGGERGIAMHVPSGVNMNMVRPGVFEAMVDAKVRTLLCSIDGATQDVYATYRRGGDLDNVLSNIRKLNQIKAVRGSEYPRLRWQFIVFGHNEHELPLARRMAEDLGMTFVPKMSWDSSYSPIRDPEFVKKETGWENVSREEMLEDTGKAWSRSMCYFLWNRPRISWDGLVLGCCGSTKYHFGDDVFAKGLRASLNGEKIVHARKMLMGQAEMRDDIPCCACGQFRHLEETGNWITPGEIADNRPICAGDDKPSVDGALASFAEMLEQGREKEADLFRAKLFPQWRGMRECLENAAKVAGALGDGTLAVRLLVQLIARHPEQASYHEALGRLLVDLDMGQEAKASFSTAQILRENAAT